ncbi:MAG TPA: DNA-formamidopyrimidine glycosylase family protein [Egibacteraceae bacterium]
MTQLPQAEVIRKELEKDVVGKRFKDVTITAPALVRRHSDPKELVAALEGRKIEAVERRGTVLLLRLDEDAVLVVRTGARGVLSRQTATEEAGETTGFVGTFTTGGALHYTDPDGDGELFVVPADELDDVPELARKGFDPLAETFTWVSLSQRLRERNTPLKPLLLDESFVVGLGDVYSDEILWAAGLSGERSSARLTSQEVRRLYRAILEVLYDAVKQGGTVSHEVSVDDDEEERVDDLRVYGHAGQPCARCRQPILHETIAGGYESYFCGNCQT